MDVCFLSYVKAVKLFSKPLCTSSTVLPGVNCAHFKMTIKNNKVLCRASLFIKFYAYIFRFSYVGEVLSALFKLGGFGTYYYNSTIFKSVYDCSHLPVWFCSCVWQLVSFLLLYST